MILDSLKIHNFRALEDLEISKLGRVSLIVGKNNVGKSSLLEALEIYASLGSPLLLEKLLDKHSENYGEKSLAIENFFTFRSEKLDKIIHIGDTENNEYVTLKPTYSVIEEIESTSKDSEEFIKAKRRKEISYEEIDSYENARLSLRIDAQNKYSKSKPPQWLDFSSYDRDDYREGRKTLRNLVIPCVVVPTGFIQVKPLAEIWDNDIALNKDYKKEILKGLNFIDKDIEDLAFRKVKKAKSMNFLGDGDEISLIDLMRDTGNSNRSPFVSVTYSSKPIPLDSMGDGIKRILQLLISIVSIENGFLLIDEFENGLHYSVQTEVWKLLFKLAKQRNIQIFATTHSLDCVRSFQKASEETEDLAMLFNLSRSKLTTDNNKIIVDGYDKERLKELVESEWELR